MTPVRICWSSQSEPSPPTCTRDEEREMDPDLLFEEEVLVKPQYADTGRLPRKLTVINRYRYSEYDTLTLDNYRIGCRPARKGFASCGGAYAAATGQIQ